MGDIQELKYTKLKKILSGLDVTWRSHYDDGNINMARVNGHSIIWHEYAYGHDDPNEYEVMFYGAEDVERVPVSELKARVQ